MYARVVRFEEGEADAIRSSAERIREDSESGPPEGIPAKQLMLLNDPEGGRSLVIAMFETEEDYRVGDETLNSMTPPGDGMGRRVSVEKYEVALQRDA